MRASFAAIAVLTLSLTASVTAAADESSVSRCISAADRGQKERDEGRLVESRATFATCGEQACPVVVQRECLRWLEEVDQRISSIVVSVKDGAGKDVVDGDVTIDGALLPAARRGREILLDPGEHRVAARRAGGPEVGETIIVRERARGRAVNLRLEARAEAPNARTPARRVPVFSWVLAGTSIVGAAGFAYFWSAGVDDVHTLRGSCAPRCSDPQIDDAARSIDAAYVSLGIGMAAAVGAVVVYLLAPRAGASVTGSTLNLRF